MSTPRFVDNVSYAMPKGQVPVHARQAVPCWCWCAHVRFLQGLTLGAVSARVAHPLAPSRASLREALALVIVSASAVPSAAMARGGVAARLRNAHQRFTGQWNARALRRARCQDRCRGSCHQQDCEGLCIVKRVGSAVLRCRLATGACVACKGGAVGALPLAAARTLMVDAVSLKGAHKCNLGVSVLVVLVLVRYCICRVC